MPHTCLSKKKNLFFFPPTFSQEWRPMVEGITPTKNTGERNKLVPRNKSNIRLGCKSSLSFPNGTTSCTAPHNTTRYKREGHFLVGVDNGSRSKSTQPIHTKLLSHNTDLVTPEPPSDHTKI